MADEKVTQAQLDEAKHARDEAKSAKESAQHEKLTADTTRGPTKAPQPDDFSLL